MMCKINHRWRDMKTCNQLFKYKNTFPSPKFPSDGQAVVLYCVDLLASRTGGFLG